VPLLGQALGGLLQPPEEEIEQVTVVSVTASDNIAVWTFSHEIAEYTFDPTGLEAASGETWLGVGGSDGSGFQVSVEYTGAPITQWRIVQAPPGLTFVGGVPMKVPQSGLVMP